MKHNIEYARIADIPVDRRAFMISQGRKYRYAWKHLHHLRHRVAQDFYIFLSRLIPHVMRWQVTRPENVIDVLKILEMIKISVVSVVIDF